MSEQRLPRGGAPVVIAPLVQGVVAVLTAESTVPGVATVDVMPDGTLRVTPVPGASGRCQLLVSASAADGTGDWQAIQVTVGDPVSQVHSVVFTAPGRYTLPALGASAATYDSTVIENIGNTTVAGIELFEEGKDWSTVDAMVASATAGLTTSDEKARALWQFARSNHAVWASATITTDLHDPVLALNSFGRLYCDDIAAVLALLFERAGFGARFWNLGVNRHTVVEAFYDGAWHMFDASLDGLFLGRDNRTVAGVEDILADTDLVGRAGWRKADLLELWRLPGAFRYPASHLTREGHRMGLTLRPGERLTLMPVVRRGLSFSDGTAPVPDAAEPPPGGAVLESRFDSGRRLSLDHVWMSSGVAPSRRGIVRSAPSGDAIFEVTTPWPVVGGRLRARVRAQAGDTVAIDITASGTGFDLDWSDLSAGRFRVPGAHVADANVRTWTSDGGGPAVHNGPGGQPGFIEYSVTPLKRPGTRTRLVADVYRKSGRDHLSVQVSRPGNRWDTVWGMSTVGGEKLDLDLTAALGPCDVCTLRLVVTGADETAGSVGFDSLALRGVAPFAWQSVWRSTDGVSGVVEAEQSVDNLVSQFDGAMVFSYHVRVRWTGTSRTPAILESLELDSNLQVSPFAIARPDARAVAVRYRDAHQARRSIRVEHRWWTDRSRRRPPAPQPTQPASADGLLLSEPILLGWSTSPDPDGDLLVAYRVEVCDQVECRYPLSSVFDETGTTSDAGQDGVFGTADDGALTEMFTTHRLRLASWLRAGATYTWRVRVQDSSGLWSDWSHLATFRVSLQDSTR